VLAVNEPEMDGRIIELHLYAREIILPFIVFPLFCRKPDLQSLAVQGRRNNTASSGEFGYTKVSQSTIFLPW